MAYVYRHIRLDKNEPFYIGIGSDSTYFRANKKSQRNVYWKRIIAKTDFEVEILFDDISWEDAKLKEKEFIALYGRKDLNNGCLVNMTEGGDGTLGKVVSKETKEKLSIATKKWSKTRVISDSQRKNASELFKRLNNDNEFTQKRIKALIESEKLKDYYKSIKGIPSGYKHSKESKNKIRLSKIGKKMPFESYRSKCKSVIQYDLDNNFIKQWDSARQIQREIGFSQGNINRCCNGEYKKAYGFKWEYVNK